MGKKILIISQAKGEVTTNEVIDWISHYSNDFIRVNGVDFYEQCDIVIKKNISLEEGMPNIPWKDIGIVWFRRWLSLGDGRQVMVNKKDAKGLESDLVYKINGFIFQELNILLEYFFYKLKANVKIFGTLNTKEINKLIVLDKAVELGLEIPDTIVTTKSKDLPKDRNKSLITKVLANGISLNEAKEIFKTYTSQLDFSKIPDRFSPSLVQSNIDKAFEIRSFMLDGRFYSMAIFSQGNEQTKVDFRKYDYDKPNRTVPFNLPNEIKDKLLQLANFFKLKTGSFDLICDKEGRYIFLEVNPGGQFGMVSYPCNYYLEKKFAECLIKHAHNE